MDRLKSITQTTAPADPVAAVLVTDDRRLRQLVLDLAASAGVRVHLVSKIPDPLLPQPPMHLFGPDAAHLRAVVPTDSAAVLLRLDAPRPGAGGDGEIYLPAQEAKLLNLLTHAANTVCRTGTVIAVRGVVGGAGTTTTSLLLAGAAASLDHDTVLLDGGAAPPALELALGLENASGIRWSDMLNAAGQLRDLPHPEALRVALPRWRSLAVLAARAGGNAPAGRSVAEVTSSLARLPGIIILDGGTPLRAGVPVAADVEVLVVPRTVAAVVQAHELLTSGGAVRPVVLTRARRGSVLSRRDVERALGNKIAGEIPEIPGLQNLLDRGTGLPGHRARCWKEARTIFEAVLDSISAAPQPDRLRAVMSA